MRPQRAVFMGIALCDLNAGHSASCALPRASSSSTASSVEQFNGAGCRQWNSGRSSASRSAWPSVPPPAAATSSHPLPLIAHSITSIQSTTSTACAHAAHTPRLTARAFTFIPNPRPLQSANKTRVKFALHPLYNYM